MTAGKTTHNGSTHRVLEQPTDFLQLSDKLTIRCLLIGSRLTARNDGTNQMQRRDGELRLMSSIFLMSSPWQPSPWQNVMKLRRCLRAEWAGVAFIFNHLRHQSQSKQRVPQLPAVKMEEMGKNIAAVMQTSFGRETVRLSGRVWNRWLATLNANWTQQKSKQAKRMCPACCTLFPVSAISRWRCHCWDLFWN